MLQKMLVRAAAVMCLLLLMVLLVVAVLPSGEQKTRDECDLSQDIVDEIKGYEPTAKLIIDSVITGQFQGETYTSLAELLDQFGPRHVGSPGLEGSIDHLVNYLQDEGLQNVHTEPAMVPHWKRGHEKARMLTPYVKTLNMMGLGYSVGTPPEGITAEVMVVNSFDELKNRTDEAVGKIVVFNPTWENYFVTAQYRTQGPVHAARAGALATLTRSMTDLSLGAPHSGMLIYDDNVKKIPAACITVEDAAMLERMTKRGDLVTVHLYMEAQNLPKTETRNVVADVTGLEQPEKMVVMTGHLDTWDNTNGAVDDGGGIAIAWSAARVLHRLGLIPRRTVRSIFFSAEEIGGKGGDEYFKAHMNESSNTTFIMESDYGIFPPLLLQFSGSDEATCVLKQILKLTESSLNFTQIQRVKAPTLSMYGFLAAGVPAAGLVGLDVARPEEGRYFWYHHSVADNLLPYTPEMLDKGTAFWALLAYVTADMKKPIPFGNGFKLANN